MLISSPALAEDYASLFESAVRKVTWEYPRNLAFTETRRGKERTEVGRYDPSRTEGERWELVSIDGRPPSAEESDDYRESRRGDRGFMSDDDDDGEEDDDSPGDFVTPGSLELLEESDQHWLLGFVPNGDGDDDEKFLKKMAGTVRIAKDGGHLEYLDISSRKPVRPTVGVKIRDFNTRFEFAPALADGPIVPVAFRFRVKGRAFVAVSFDEAETVEFSDFEPVSD
jgi:hypothetical protein